MSDERTAEPVAEPVGDRPDLEPTDRTRLRRKVERGRFDRATVAGILDEGLVAHVGFAGPAGVCVLPMVYARVGDQLYLHGAAGNSMLRALGDGADLCVTVTLLDGLVLSRSAFHHSMNYRSVVIFGRAEVVDDPDEKQRVFLAMVDHVVAGRSAECRAPSEAESRKTRVLRLAITEASAKVRTGPPVEEPDDLALPYWGGVVPVTTAFGTAIPDAHVGPDVALRLA
jgi:nitroimidazol reductase NimA-like FMN-containing flavoprotein (pyridoxamine 5'-phosphate oxidase superfamily)